MNSYYTLKYWLKLGRWRGRRWLAAARWGRDSLQQTPCVLGNAMPKSGSHLVSQIIQGLPLLGPFVNPGFMPVTRGEDNRKLSELEILANLRRMKPGDIAYGYLNAREPFISEVTKPGWAVIFVYRDPRDVVISHVFYATEMHEGHGMHHYYTQVLKTMEQRIEAAIRGVEEPGAELSSIRTKYENYLGWFEQPFVLCLRFEDLISKRQVALEQILDHLEERGFKPKISRQQALILLQKHIAPRKSGTFRKGQPGGWKEFFSEANKALFKEIAGDLLLRLGYETENDW